MRPRGALIVGMHLRRCPLEADGKPELGGRLLSGRHAAAHADVVVEDGVAAPRAHLGRRRRLPREILTGIAAASEHDAALWSRRADARLGGGDRGGARRVLAGVGCSKQTKKRARTP